MEKQQNHAFSADTGKLLKLMIHSLYSNKEIFLRELVSNAADAADKLRFKALSDGSLFEDDADLRVRLSFDEEAKTITISDNGIGMTQDEVIEHLGTIAKSGTSDFFEQLSGDQVKDSQLIGQFGVGFYSAFIVADKVTVNTRKAGDDASQGTMWESTGEADYTVANIEKADRGTEIILHLRDDETEFLNDYKLRSVVSKYSDHISIPVQMFKDAVPESEGPDGEKVPAVEATWESINKATALWNCAKSDLKDEEYKEFYKHIANDFEDPLTWSHNKVEGEQEYTSLLYIPKRAPYDLWNREKAHGLKLYVQRVFIMDDAEQFMPTYLRFVKGVLDSNDLPLNVSREILQDTRVTTKLRSACTKRALTMLTKFAKKNETEYNAFWKEFGQVLKEGPAEDPSNKEQIAKLFRFASTETDKADQTVSLDAYISRMNEEQDKIYYITADSFNAAKNSPHLEILRKKGIEVLLLSDRVDEWLLSHLPEYDGKAFISVTQGDLDLGKLDTEEEKKEQEKQETEFASFIERTKKVLGDKVKDVRLTQRLTSTPSCIVADSDDMSTQMAKLMAQMGQPVPDSKPIFELNPEHEMITKLADMADEELFAEWTELLLAQAILSEKGSLDDPSEFVARINKLLIA
ncbi:molecular chaperone HtpG [Psychromonas sp. 14N.309.X.WAT.B.A12]|uniref:molecular chaperone HtpG n=1 Tax=unclassified Psychromonas TaxID=2614957 RepID=UPI0025B0DC4E|nr:molecular chaperone HtpG [Psychromonas sp. 14N.309.X.WAT.B.A12]MDN2664212.1 molecular chaperone HtpG [Psychromonas sp. 14N.309.X.WAT.B.A12]